ncbi:MULTISPECIES: hypothetical protein [Lactobacillus]|uniref:Uncharacterized protein n=1 Tax=Lactobacillus xujianguonis TaxID=2495899 RepID=A0A437STC3_9LACO|nr:MULTISPECIES: hypothetical protein [Lactobacillus]RVU70180.1 hypothetical protein EJK17_09110 [Lactobacillus xujianguonis]RVU73515.1 hypothetical protein EJK20_07730 [Lactobacillus xujianguonis]
MKKLLTFAAGVVLGVIYHEELKDGYDKLKAAYEEGNKSFDGEKIAKTLEDHIEKSLIDDYKEDLNAPDGWYYDKDSHTYRPDVHHDDNYSAGKGHITDNDGSFNYHKGDDGSDA